MESLHTVTLTYFLISDMTFYQPNHLLSWFLMTLKQLPTGSKDCLWLGRSSQTKGLLGCMLCRRMTKKTFYDSIPFVSDPREGKKQVYSFRPKKLKHKYILYNESTQNNNNTVYIKWIIKSRKKCIHHARHNTKSYILLLVESLLVSECHDICFVASNEVETIIEGGAHDTLQWRRDATQLENSLQVCAFAQLVRLYRA